jgi:hypothetical protein
MKDVAEKQLSNTEHLTNEYQGVWFKAKTNSAIIMSPLPSSKKLEGHSVNDWKWICYDTQGTIRTYDSFSASGAQAASAWSSCNALTDTCSCL